MQKPTKKGRTPSSTPNNQNNRKLDALELELRRLGRACEQEENEPASCSVYHLAADSVQARARRGDRTAPAPALPEVKATPAASADMLTKAEAPPPAVQPIEAVGPSAGASAKADTALGSPDTTGSTFGSSYP